MWLLAVLVSYFSKAAAGDEALLLRVPDILDCDDNPAWRAFRLQTREAVEQGFVKSKDLEEAAAQIEEQWRPWVCQSPDGGPCMSSGDLSFEFVRDLHGMCKDSNNFERYLIRHYFTNTKTSFVAREEPSGFCLYGYITALVVLAWHALPDYVGEALRHLYTAHHMLGHYHSFDYIQASSWPVTSFLIILNLGHGGNEFMPFLSPPDYGHPGQYGTSWYFDRLSWEGTVEVGKSRHRRSMHGLLDISPKQVQQIPQLTVWHFCIHTSTAGEALTMITRFLRDDVDVKFMGNSVAFTLCGNYQPSLCATGKNAEFIDRLATSFMVNDEPYEVLSNRFRDYLLDDLNKADVWMCSIPAIWCHLLADAARAQGEYHKPIFVYLGLPILQYVRESDRESFLHVLRDIVRDEQNVVVANNAYLAEEVLWQIGLKIPTVRIHGLHTNATYVPLRNSEVLITRPGTSGGWQECLLNRFVEANAGYPLRFVQFTDLLNPHTTKEVYNTSLSYADLAQYRALINFPYDTSLMLFWEFYSMGMPMFVPFQLWHWGIYGQHTRPDLSEPRILPSEDEDVDHRPPYSMFFDGFRPLELDRALYWSKFTDWAMFPHVQYFDSLADLMNKLVVLDMHGISARMKYFNEESMIHSVKTWRHIVERWFEATQRIS